MSMNLQCSGIELRQTPTQITYMCMVQPDGEVMWNLKGKKARHAMQIYKEWVKYCRNGIVFEDGEELTELIAFDKEHLAAVDEAMKQKNFEVWII